MRPRTHNQLILILLLLCSTHSLGQDTTVTAPPEGPVVVTDVPVTEPNYVSSTDSTIYVINKITMLQNEVTKESIILRELTFATGDTIMGYELQDHLTRSASNLFNTRLFNFVEVLPAEGADGYLDIMIIVTERWYIWPIVVFEFADPNFNTWWQTKDFGRLNYGLGAYHANFRGRNEKLGFLVQLGYSKKFRLSYDMPFINKKQNIGMGFSYSYTQNEQITIGTQDNIRIFLDGLGGRLQRHHLGKMNVSWRNDLYNRMSLEVRYNDVVVNDTITSLSNDYFVPGESSSSFLGLVYNYVHDKRDNVAYPLKGYTFGATLVKHGLGLGFESDVDVLYSLINARGHWQLGERIFGALSLRGKLNIAGDIPYFIQQGFGYGNYVRGYELYVIDGQHYLLGKSNLKFQLIKPQKEQLPFGMSQFSLFHYALYMNLFVDAGRVWDDLYAAQNTLANEPIFGWGTGLDLVAYYDKVLRLEYSFNSIGESGMFIHFAKSF